MAELIVDFFAPNIMQHIKARVLYLCKDWFCVFGWWETMRNLRTSLKLGSKLIVDFVAINKMQHIKNEVTQTERCFLFFKF